MSADPPAAAEADAIDDQTLARAERALVDLVDTVDGTDGGLAPADLERLRQSLPTDPDVAQMVHAGMPRALHETFEYVHPSDRQAGYWRKSRERSDVSQLSDAELRQRAAFVDSRIDHRGRMGTERQRDGRRLSRSSQATAAELRGESFRAADDPPTETERERGEGLLDRLRSYF